MHTRLLNNKVLYLTNVDKLIDRIGSVDSNKKNLDDIKTESLEDIKKSVNELEREIEKSEKETKGILEKHSKAEGKG